VVDIDTPSSAAVHPLDVRHEAARPRRWTLHGLNNGLIFGATNQGVRLLPRRLSYAIGHAGTWLAWRFMTETRRAIAANLSAVFPDESEEVLEARALHTLRSYARDTIDFLRALSDAPRTTERLFDLKPEHRAVIVETYYRGRSVADTAQVLGVPEGTVKSRCYYALRALKLALAERGVTR